MITYQVVKTLDQLREQLSRGSLANTAIQALDLSGLATDWSRVEISNTAFIGCIFDPLEQEIELRLQGALVFPPITGLPYDPFRKELYKPEELMVGYEQGSLAHTVDARIYNHFQEHGSHDSDIIDALAQRIHDYSIDNAIKELLQVDSRSGLPARKAVGVMGGHKARRDDPNYLLTVKTSWQMTREGYFIVSGGGPGIMEAANLGAYLANYKQETLKQAVDILAEVPDFLLPNGHLAPGYVELARKVKEKYPDGAENLAIPTWFYGHEPVNLFPSHIGKYFSNSIREDGLLAISYYGIIFAPGAAATTQEVFADATQNHYGTFDYYSPMVFLGTHHYLQSQIYSCLTQQAAGNIYAQLITITDDPNKVVKFIKEHPPIATSKRQLLLSNGS